MTVASDHAARWRRHRPFLVAAGRALRAVQGIGDFAKRLGGPAYLPINEIEATRLQRLEQAPVEGPTAMVRLVARVIGIGIETADMLVHEIHLGGQLVLRSHR